MFSAPRYAALVVFVFSLLGCEQKTSSSASTETADAGSPKVLGKVERALENAVRAGGSPASASSSGPPPDGVMDPVRAESEVPSGSAPKLTLGGEGTTPKTLLRGAQAEVPKALTMELTIQGAMEQGLPVITVAMGLETKKSTDVEQPLSVVAKLRDVRISVPNAPADLKDQLLALKGSKISFSLTRSGAGYGFSSELAPGAKPELRELLDSVREGLALYTVPVPMVPVGAGAFWMVASRELSAGFGLMSYRMVKLASVSDKTFDLEFDARRYAIGRAVDPALLGPGAPPATLREMSAAAKARLTIDATSLLPTAWEGSSAMRGAVDAGEAGGPKGQLGQRMVQAGTGYRIVVAK